MNLTPMAGRLTGQAIIELLKHLKENRSFEEVFRKVLTAQLEKRGNKNKRIIDRVLDSLISDTDIQAWLDSPQLPDRVPIVEKLADKLKLDVLFVRDLFLAFEMAIAKNPTLNTILQNRRDATKTHSLQEILRGVIGQATEAQVQAQLTAIRRYNEKVRRRFSTIMLFGERKHSAASAVERMADMQHGFVPLHLKPWRDDDEERDEELLDLEQVFFQNREPLRLLIRGLPGSGKTTLLRYLAWRFATANGEIQPIPVYIRLKKLNLAKKTLEDFIRQQLKNLCPDRQTETALLDEDCFLENRMILLLDGIDEIEDPDSYARFAEVLQELALDHPRSTIIISSRPIGLKKEDYPEFTPLDLDVLTPEMIDAYLEKWFGGDEKKIAALQATLDERPRMLALARNPFLLSMICFTYAEGGDTALVERRSALYAECTKFLLARLYDPESAKTAELSKDKAMAMLQELALRYFLWQEADFPADEVNVLARRVIPLKAVRLPEKFLNSLEEETGLIQRAQEGFTFVHRTLWEYFTARALLDKKKSIDFVIRHAGNPDWEEVVRLYAGLLEQKEKVEELIRGLWNINRPLALRVSTEVETPAAELLKPLIEAEAGNQGKLLLIDSLAQSLPLVSDAHRRKTLVDETLRILLIDCEETDCQVIYHAQELLERVGLQPLAEGGLIYELLDLGNALQHQQDLLADPKNHFEWIDVEGGEFLMGDDDHEPDERPAHPVRVDSFRMMKHPVTNRMLWEFPYGSKYRNEAENLPVTGNTWWEAYYFALWLGCRLPTEAEWEYAARGGKKRRKDSMQYYFDGGADELPNHAWFGEPTRRVAYPVNEPNPHTGREHLNPLGLANMLGNVWEWCADWYDSHYYEDSPLENPPGPESGTRRVLRGGAFNSSAVYLRCAYRGRLIPSSSNDLVGFRFVQDGLVNL